MGPGRRGARGIAEQGRDPATFRIAKRVYLGVGDDGSVTERVGEALRELYGYFGTEGIEAVGVSGTPAEVAGQLRRVADAGAELILLNPLFDEAEQMERVAAEVLPLLDTAGV